MLNLTFTDGPRCLPAPATSEHLGVRLASSDPNEIFSILEFDGKQLVQGTSTIAHAWAGAHTFCRSGWIPEITASLDVSAGIAPPAAWWNSPPVEETKDIIPFHTDDIFADNAFSMHDTEKHSRVELGIDMTKKHVDPKEWMAAFVTIKDSPGESRDTLLKLALTPVQVFGNEWFVDSESTKMMSSSVTNFWIGACRLAGSP
jgi:hypothetical protein